ncbi:LysR family transcriptional regulator [Pseudooceanicola sp. CBS1P-1]|uniref:LysR family transcriptional regulator n=1 Tax=Pseudooceanicola albus TaxID=2692189 RepID=A0A6L7G828_9RHOB|nr:MULTISPECIES: LysR family transcriptional regulator [Pseudooceanicola]MBT9386013.1 LysR family transcriptional regulator [Pseudooceanicola endophyticus]MXN19566.1 LysR family transcriptional regulator [Pseudooceanicola albus]
MDLQALDFFIKVADARSLSAAARLHGIPKSSISLKLRQLEERIGAVLFERRGKSLEMTESGRLLMARARQILALCDDAQAAVAAVQEEAAGLLRIGASGEFGTALNAQMLQAFRALNPRVRVDLVLFGPNDQPDAAQQRSFDAILSSGDAETAQGAEVLSRVHHRLVASPAYLAEAGTPESIDDLAAHRGIFYRAAGEILPWELTQGRRRQRVQPSADVVANDYWSLKYFAVAGAGIALLPAFFTELEVAHGHLVPVLPDWQTQSHPITVRVPDPRYVAPRTRAFLEFCKDYFQPGFAYAGPRYFVDALSFGPDAPTGEKKEP